MLNDVVQYHVIFSRGTLPCGETGLMIVNINPHDKPGEYWIAIYVDTDGEYYTSIGRQPPPSFWNISKWQLINTDIELTPIAMCCQQDVWNLLIIITVDVRYCVCLILLIKEVKTYISRHVFSFCQIIENLQTYSN